MKIYSVLLVVLVAIVGDFRRVASGSYHYERRNRFDPSMVNTELSHFLHKLWLMDETRLTYLTDYKINLQGIVKSIYPHYPDMANGSLITNVNEEKLFKRNTFKALHMLLDNYRSDSEEKEHIGGWQQQEAVSFLSHLMDTRIMKEAHKFLSSRYKSPSNSRAFQAQLLAIWFALQKHSYEEHYPTTCGFERVFLGERRKGEVEGMYNWVQFYFQEKQGNINYRGHFEKETILQHNGSPRFVTIQYRWQKAFKAKSALMIGTSPEFEIAFYTLVHLLGNEVKPYYQFGHNTVKLVTKKLNTFSIDIAEMRFISH